MNAISGAPVHNNPFHIYLNKKIDKPDFTGLKIRVTPVYRDIVQALGATPMQTAPGEVYTALERGVVDGYGWPITGIFDLGWHEKTKFRVEPGFYSAEVTILVNKAAWDKLNDAQRKHPAARRPDRGRKEAAETAEENAEDTASGRPTPASRSSTSKARRRRKRYRDKAYEAGWAGVIKQSPEHGPKLREFFAKSQLTGERATASRAGTTICRCSGRG